MTEQMSQYYAGFATAIATVLKNQDGVITEAVENTYKAENDLVNLPISALSYQLGLSSDNRKMIEKLNTKIALSPFPQLPVPQDEQDFNIVDLNKLMTDVYQTNIEKGFWGTEIVMGVVPQDIVNEREDAKLSLIISEIGESIDADRENKLPDYEAYESAVLNGIDPKAAFKTYIKDTKPDELADVAIRHMDLMCAKSYYFHNYTVKHLSKFAGQLFKGNDYAGDALQLIKSYIKIYSVKDSAILSEEAYQEAFLKLLAFCKLYNQDVWKHIHLKMSFNKKREYLHGKNY